MSRKLALIAVTLGAVLLSSAGASATTINGDLTFTGSALNAFDPANGLVPAGYGNSSQSTAVTVGPGVEFGHQEPGLVLVTADFTANSLVFQNTCVSPEGGCVNS